jgi:hypothetical protein
VSSHTSRSTDSLFVTYTGLHSLNDYLASKRRGNKEMGGQGDKETIQNSKFKIQNSHTPHPTPDSRFPTPDSRLPTPDSRILNIALLSAQIWED